MSSASPIPASTRPAYLSAATGTPKQAITTNADPPTMETAVNLTSFLLRQSGTRRRAQATTAKEATPIAPSNRA